ncbi:MAG: hypothetical protein M0R34_07235 [Candidatus Marinimicrobia bacterium]|nr:hypothetical protein [Candidatus Neomarinimicrobiota bacterium]
MIRLPLVNLFVKPAGKDCYQITIKLSTSKQLVRDWIKRHTILTLPVNPGIWSAGFKILKAS